MTDPTRRCSSCGAPTAARRLAVLEIDLGADDDHEVALDRVPGRIRRRLPSRRRRIIALAAGVLGVAAGTVNAVAGAPGRPSVLPATVTVPTSAPVTAAAVPAPAGPMFGEATGLRLVVLAAPDLAAVDLDTGRAVTLDTDLVGRSTGAPAVATSAGLAFVDRDGGASVLAANASTSRSVLAPSPGSRVTAVLGEGPVGHLWVVMNADEVGTVDLSAAGAATFEPVGTVPTGATVRADGVGGAVVGAPGGVYRLVPGRPATRLTGGALLDARAGRLLSLECDDAMVCAGQVLDLADGARWRVALPAGADLTTVGLAPDGQWVVRSVPDPEGASATVDLAGRDGTVLSLGATALTCGDAGCRPTVAWSPDGRWLVGATPGGDLWGWRAGLAEPVVAPTPDRGGRPLPVAAIVALTASGAAPA